MTDSSDQAEIECTFNAALARRGIGGRVVLRGTSAELRAGPEVIAIELGDWVEQWPLFPPEIQARKVHAALDRLVSAAQGRPATAQRRPGAWLEPIRRGVVVALLVGAVAAALYWLRGANFFGTPESAEGRATDMATSAPAFPGELDPSRQSATVCEAARARLLRGGTLAGFDVAGWETVVWLARVDGSAQWQGALEQQLRAGEVADLARKLLQSPQPGAITHARPAERSGMAAARKGTGLRLRGDLVGAFFDPGRRAALLGFAQRLTADHDAQLAGLYAQCAHLDTHDVGGWYYGQHDAQAVAALIFLSAVTSNPRSSAANRFGAPDDGLARLVEAARGLPQATLERAIARHGGTLRRVAATPHGQAPTDDLPPAGTHIAFPTGALTHATAAARTLLAAIDEQSPAAARPNR